MGEVSKGEGRTVLFVSHNLGSIAQLCTSCIFMKNGMFVQQGNTNVVIQRYVREGISFSASYHGPQMSDKKIWFKKINPADKNGLLKDQFFHDEEIFFDFELCYNVPKDNHEFSVFVMILDENKTRVFSTDSTNVKGERLQLVIDSNFLVRGSYSIHTFIHKPQVEQIDVAEDVCNFTVVDNGSHFFIHGNYDYGRVFGKSKWHQK